MGIALDKSLIQISGNNGGEPLLSMQLEVEKHQKLTSDVLGANEKFREVDVNLLKVKRLIQVNQGGMSLEDSPLLYEVSDLTLEKALLERIEEQNRAGEEVTTLNIQNFDSEEGSEIKGRIHNLIGNNFPMLEVMRLHEGMAVLDMTFLGLKQLNDLIGKEFMDLFIGAFKKLMKYRLSKVKDSILYKGEKGNFRIVRSNYKHHTSSIDERENVLNDFFGGCQDIKRIIAVLFDCLNKDEVNHLLRESKIQDIKQVRGLLMKYFDIGVGTSKVAKDNSKNPTGRQKLIAFYGAEISSRERVNLRKKGESTDYSFEMVENHALKALSFEKTIIKDFADESFEFNGSTYPIIVQKTRDRNGNIIDARINEKLLKYVRKDENIGNLRLKSLVEKYIFHLNSGFDFIAPYIPGDTVDEIPKINRQIKEGEIDISYLEQNYKNTKSVAALKVQSKGRKGMRVVIDIVDMGLMNLRDFRELADKVMKGEITAKNLQELIEAGKTATLKFQRIVARLKKKYPYPEGNIALGGDEIYLFIEDQPEIESSQVLSDISEELTREGISGRSSFSFNRDNPHIYDTLDSFGGISKPIEMAVEKVVQDSRGPDIEIDLLESNGQGGPMFNNIIVDIDSKLQSFISTNIGDFIDAIKISLTKGKRFQKYIKGEIDICSFGVSVGREKFISVSINKKSDNILSISVL